VGIRAMVPEPAAEPVGGVGTAGIRRRVAGGEQRDATIRSRDRRGHGGAEARDGAQEGPSGGEDRRRHGRDGPRRPHRRAAPGRAAHDRPVWLERDRDRAIDVGPVDLRPGRRKPVDRRPGRVAVRVVGPSRGDRDPGLDHREERVGGRGTAAVVGDLEDVDRREPGGDQGRVDLLLDVAGQQEAVPPDGPQENDRDVVDPGPVVGWLGRDGSGDGPADLQRHVVDGKPVAGRDGAVGRGVGAIERR
jgi:hypothetical protein